MAENDVDQTLTTEEKPKQQVSIEDAGPARKLLTIELPEERLHEKIESMYTELSDDAVIPGFRRGRAPRRLIEKRFGDSVNEDVKNQLLQDSYTQAIEDHDLKVVGEPEIKDIESITIPESGPLTYQVEVEIVPEVNLPSLEGIKVIKRINEVTESDIDKEVDQYRQRMGTFTEITDKPVKAGDFIQADVKIHAGKNPDEGEEPIIHQPGAYILVNGQEKGFKGHVAGILIDDLGKRLAGKKSGHVETVQMTGPIGYEDERIKDQPITITIKIDQIERVEPAPMETIIAQAGYTTEEDLRNAIRNMIEQRHEREQQQDMHNQISDFLMDQVDLELPEGLTGRQTDRVLKRQALEMVYIGTPPEEIDQKLAEARSGSEEEARKQLKLLFILDKAARDLNIEVAQGEINGHIATIAAQQQRRPEKLRQEMAKRGELENLYLQIRELKTLNQILSKAEITESAVEKEDISTQKKKPSKKKTDDRVADRKKEKTEAMKKSPDDKQ